MVLDYIDRLVGEEQANYVHAWIKLRRAAFLGRNFRSSQALIIAGAADLGSRSWQ